MSEKMPHNQESPSIDPTLPDDILADTGLNLAYAANEAFDASRTALAEHQAQDRRFQALSDAAGALIGSSYAEKGSQAMTPEKDERSLFLESLSDRERKIAEELEIQLLACYTAYQEHSEALGIPTEIAAGTYEQVFFETLSDWHTRGILDYLATDLEDNGNEPLLVSVPNAHVGLAAHRQAAVAFGKGQPCVTQINNDLWGDNLTPEQISGTPRGTAEFRFRVVPSGYTKALGENTASEQRKLLRSLQRDSATSQLGLEDVPPLEAVASWYALRQQRGGGRLVGNDVFDRTVFRHVTLPEKRLSVGRDVPASYVFRDGGGRAVLGGSWSGSRIEGRVSVG